MNEDAESGLPHSVRGSRGTLSDFVKAKAQVHDQAKDVLDDAVEDGARNTVDAKTVRRRAKRRGLSQRQDPPLSSHEEVLSQQDLQLLRPLLRKRRMWPPMLLWVCLTLISVPLPLLLLILLVHEPKDLSDYGWLLIMAFAASLYLVYQSVSQLRRMLRSVRHSAELASTALRKQIIRSTLLGMEPGSSCGVVYQLAEQRIEVSLPGYHHLAFNEVMGELPKSAHARCGAQVSLHLLLLPGGSLPLLLRADYHDSPAALTHTTAIGAGDYRDLRAQSATFWKWILVLAGLSLLVGLIFDELIQALALSVAGFWLVLGVLGTALVLWPWLGSRHKFQVEGQIDETIRYEFYSGSRRQLVCHCRIGGVLYRLPQCSPPPMPGQRLMLDCLLRRDGVTLEPLTLAVRNRPAQG